MIDGLVTLAAIGMTGIFWRSLGPLNVGVTKALGIAFGYAILYSLVGVITGANRVAWSEAAMADAMELVLPVGLATVIAILVNYFWIGESRLPTELVLMASVLSFAGFVLVRYRSRLFQELAERWLITSGSALQAQERVLIIGSGESGQFMAWWLNNGRNQGIFRIVGYVDDDLYKQDTRIRGVNVLGRREDIPQLVAAYDVGIILFAIHNIPIAERNRVLDICRATAARVYIVPDILESLRKVANGYNGEAHTAGEVEEGQSKPASTLGFKNWLDDLDKRADLGDLEGVHEQIRQMREELTNLSGEIKTQG
jgi:FlaA1/EpsC-like NDP-sugar epimerase